MALPHAFVELTNSSEWAACSTSRGETLRASVAESLRELWGEIATPNELGEIAEEAIERYRDAPVVTFIPILAQRSAREIARERFSHLPDRSVQSAGLETHSDDQVGTSERPGRTTKAVGGVPPADG